MDEALELEGFLKENGVTPLSPTQLRRIVVFREEVLRENQVQNLTRLLSPKDFYEGHVLDVLHLEKSGLVNLPALDLGAGVGVPGLLHSLIFAPKGTRTWISSDSERKKAEFGERMIRHFSLEGVVSCSVRGEDFLDNHTVETVVARAVGSVSKLYGWLRTRSTWNTLVLFKGPRWEEEWKEFESSPHRGRLRIDTIYEYEVGQEGKKLKIVKLVKR